MPSYFYKDDGGEISSFETLYHESSHQLLFENAGPALFEYNLGNYWPFEGLGTYFETVRPQPDGTLLIGGRTGRRFDVARTRILGRKEYTQLDRFVAMSKKTFLDPPEGSSRLRRSDGIYHLLARIGSRAVPRTNFSTTCATSIKVAINSTQPNRWMIAWERRSRCSTASFSSFWPTRRSRPSVDSIGHSQRRTATAERRVTRRRRGAGP